MEDINLGTSLVFTTTCGKAGLFLTLQGYLNSITTIADMTWHFKYVLHKNVGLCICRPTISLFFMNSTFDTYDPRCKPQRLLCANSTLGRAGMDSWSTGGGIHGNHDDVRELYCWKEINPLSFSNLLSSECNLRSQFLKIPKCVFSHVGIF